MPGNETARAGNRWGLRGQHTDALGCNDYHTLWTTALTPV